MTRRFQHRGTDVAFFLLIVCSTPWDSVLRLMGPSGTNTHDPAILQSAACAAFAWLLGAVLAISNNRPGRLEPWPWFRQRRVIWSWGCAFVLLHVAVAMHAGHGWSHGAAFRHTEEVGGFGPGVYVNYLFGAVWAGDALWMWAAPNAYRRRPRWVGRAVHGFLAFIVFNATVVFASSPFLRAVAILLSVALALHIAGRWRARPRSERGAAPLQPPLPLSEFSPR